MMHNYELKIDVSVVAIIVPSGTSKRPEVTIKIFSMWLSKLWTGPYTFSRHGASSSGQIFFFFHGATAPGGPGPPNCRGFTITLRIPWTRDQPDAGTST